MCPDKSLFYTLKEVQGRKVFMSNNHPCQTIRIETVKLIMHDRVVCTLSEVQCVPDLKNNLISLSVLDSKGHKIVIAVRVLKILSGALVVMKRKK